MDLRTPARLLDRVGIAWRMLLGRSDWASSLAGSGSSTYGFAGAAVGRLQSSLANWSGSINADLDGALPILRARARQLAANNEHGRRFLSLCAINIVGRQNPKLQVRALRDARNPDRPATLDKAANDAIEQHWERWGKSADVTGRHKSLYAVLRTIVRAVARDGEAIVRIIRNRSLPYGIGLQLLESDRLDDTLNMRLQNGNTIRQGVEIDSLGRPVAYHVKTSHPGESFAMAAGVVERIPAADLCHIYLPDRAEQVRGVTWMHAVILRGATLHKFEEAAVTAAQIGASKIAAIERSEDSLDASSMMFDGRSSSGIGQINVEAGEMFELPPGYRLNSWNPEYPHANFDPFLKACLRGLAAGLDVAAHNLTGDMTDVNYSSARIAELSEREAWMILQDWLIGSFVQPIYEEWLAMALLMGQITFPQSGSVLPADRLQKFVLASSFRGRRWQWVDPLKDGQANQVLLAARLTSRTRITAEQGVEFDDLVDELADEQQQLEDAGLAASPEPAAPAVAADQPPP
jgi:lambda family phage portal protein